MFLSQHSTGPRWTKKWFPLATQQLRLRNLIKILAFGIQSNQKEALAKNSSDTNIGTSNESYYFTLHSTTMSAPFYTSEKLISDSPKWKELEISFWKENICPSVDAVVIRLWLCSPNESEDKVLAVWGIYLSGLLYLGPKLTADIPLKPNSLVLLMPGGYFTDPKCIEINSKLRCISVIVKNCDVRQSYSVSSFRRIHMLQHVIKKDMTEADMLKKKISMGDFFRNETRSRTTLKRLLNKHKAKTNQVDLIRVKENIEITKYRVNILKEEKEIISKKLKNLQRQIHLVADSNKLLELSIMEYVKVLKQQIFNHKEWKRSYIDKREKFVHSKALLNFRKKQLISELNLIYPIVKVSPEKYMICGVHLPNSEDFAGHDDLQISVALGFVTHIIQMISVFLQIPLRYPVIHYGSRSRILDLITDKISDCEREFCLYVKGKEKLQFHYAVYLLNKNIAQMRWLCGLPTSDLRNTLENLSSLIKMKIGNSALDPSSKSLSSSTADISNVSVSSPLDSVLSYQSKKDHRISFVSGNRGDLYEKSVNNLCVLGYHFSESEGYSKDFIPNLQRVKRKNLMTMGNNGLSCSLDEGLNEFEEKTKLDKRDIDQYNSEPMLNTNLNNTVQNLKPNSSNYFTKAWETKLPLNLISNYMPNEHTIDTSSKKQNNSGVDNVSKDIVDDCYSSFPFKTKGIKFEGRIVESNNKFMTDTNEIKSLATSSDTNFFSQNKKVGSGKNVLEESKSNEGIRKYDLPNPLIKDNLLENVTNRTEALVHHITSFNRFRTRFKSTLESSN